MKKWSIVLAAAMALSLACPMGSLADDNPKAQYGTPVIDGKIDAIWNTTDKISVIWAGDETATRYNAADKPLKDSYARVMWDENNLYFLVYAATDKTPSDPADAPSSVVRFMTEQVTLFVSETADDLGRYYDNSGNWQLLVNPYERNSKPSTGALTSNKTNIKTATASCVRNASDYLCEISIPWSEKGNHKAGDWLGFNFGINDDMDENGARDYYVSWANPSYQRYWEAPDLPIVELAGNAPAKPTTKPNTNATTKAPDTPAKTTAASQAEASSEPEDVSSEAPVSSDASDATQPESSVPTQPSESASKPDTTSNSSDTPTNIDEQGGFSPLWIVLIVAGVLVIAGGVVFILFKKKVGPFAGNRS